MPNALIVHSSNTSTLVPADAGKDATHRLRQFAAWLDGTGRTWHNADLHAYRDHLLARGLKATSVAAHLSTIRGRYADLMRSNDVRDGLYNMSPADTSAADKKAFVDEMILRLTNAIHPTTAPVQVVKEQDVEDAAHIRLTIEQANALLAAPGVDTFTGLRDTAVIAVLLCTGVREAELCALDVDDLRQRLGGTLALRVREGKGAKKRLIPYGDLDWCLAYVDAWMNAAGITAGAVFRGLYKAAEGKSPKLRDRLSVRAVQDILDKYPVMIDGRMVTIDPHDARRTYARRLYETGVELLAIQQNLGHADLKTTQGYIGALSPDARKPKAVYTPPHWKDLKRVSESQSV